MLTKKSQGFTLLELVVVLAVLAILSGVVIPVVKKVLDRAKVTSVTSTVDRIRDAVMRFYQDTGLYPAEDPSSSDPCDHNLAFDPGESPGNDCSDLGTVVARNRWNGPYIDHPMQNDLPWANATITLRAGLRGHDDSFGYYLLGYSGGSGHQTYQATAGCEIILTNIPNSFARSINDDIDGDEGTDAQRQNDGRVNYSPGASTSTMGILVFDALGQ